MRSRPPVRSRASYIAGQPEHVRGMTNPSAASVRLSCRNPLSGAGCGLVSISALSRRPARDVTTMLSSARQVAVNVGLSTFQRFKRRRSRRYATGSRDVAAAVGCARRSFIAISRASVVAKTAARNQTLEVKITSGAREEIHSQAAGAFFGGRGTPSFRILPS
jgi:hypothetical protein